MEKKTLNAKNLLEGQDITLLAAFKPGFCLFLLNVTSPNFRLTTTLVEVNSMISVKPLRHKMPLNHKTSNFVT